MKISDIEKGTEVDGQVFAIRSFEVNEGAKGQYAKCVLFDATGELQGMWFDYPGSRTTLEPDEHLVRVTGTGDEFNGTRQIKIKSAAILPPQDDDFDWSPYIRATLFPQKVLEAEILEFVESFTDPEIGAVVGELVVDNLDDLLVMPAALENHHAWRGGLAEHIVSMAWLALRVADHYQAMYGTYQDDPVVDRDLLLAGVLLHDLAKIFDFEEDGLGWAMGAHSVLVGHIPECDARIREACKRCGVSERTEKRLRHMVLSHHGTKEWGSPATPALLEAQLLHYVDMIDSRFAMVREIVADLEPGEVSQRSWALRGRVTK